MASLESNLSDSRDRNDRSFEKAEPHDFHPIELMESSPPLQLKGSGSELYIDFSDDLYKSVFELPPPPRESDTAGVLMLASTSLENAQRQRDDAVSDYVNAFESREHPIEIIPTDFGSNRNIVDETEYFRSLERAHQSLDMMLNSPAGASLLSRESDVRLRVVPAQSELLPPGQRAGYNEFNNEITVRSSALMEGNLGETTALLAEEYLHPFVPGYGRREEVYTRFAAVQIARAAGGDLPAPNIVDITNEVDAEYTFLGIEFTNVRQRIGELGITNIPDMP